MTRRTPTPRRRRRGWCGAALRYRSAARERPTVTNLATCGAAHTLRRWQEVAGDIDHQMGTPGSHGNVQVVLTRRCRRTNRDEDTVRDRLARRVIQRSSIRG